MWTRNKPERDSQLWEDWSRQLRETGQVQLAAGRRVIATVNAEGVFLPARDLLVRWPHLGFADGGEYGRLDSLPSTLTLTVSRTWWSEHIAASTGKERRRAEREMAKGWATPSVSFNARSGAHVEAFGEWLSAEAVVRAPIPDRFYLSPAAGTPVFDRDSNRPVPLDRLPVSHSLRDRFAAWAAAGDAVPEEDRGRDETWEHFLPEGRALAAALQGETGRPAAVWADCPDVP